ncbi:MAG: phosphate/phosphite/phosphonate ABC transporter substrate-binding protein [Spirochaetales bacterium]|nr:phosphate/phosphite/phosphonate ABC transporter substrate-binding protein [Leptospiraceae bacterium]MCP5481274.1 phosphate/phosphite/phosphonate ABC transporter substrate-binding protein [Spirochaetales bacterium]MCP5485710.1 phosphate/phosphite/phosphonate ABC transporter substrate-binding protein [Spirochaetales bacterium]
MSLRRFVILLTVACSACGPDACGPDLPPGSEGHPLQVRLIASGPPEAAEAMARELEPYLERELSIEVRVAVNDSAAELVDGFAYSEVHVAFLNTFAYLVAHKWGGADAGLCLRFRSGRCVYQGGIVVRADSGITAPEDLNGKKFAFKDPYATSGYLLALQYLDSHSITPASTAFAGSYHAVVEGVYDGTYDAGAVYADRDTDGTLTDARSELTATHADAAQRLSLLAETGEIPSGPVAFDSRLPSELRDRVVAALLKWGESDRGRETLSLVYGARGLAPSQDEDYMQVRRTVARLGQSVERLVPDGGGLVIRERLYDMNDDLP